MSPAKPLRHLTILLLLCAAGCELFGSKSKVQTIRSAGTDAREAEEATVRRVIELLAARVRTRGDGALDILLLSGGGQHGAYGTGFLRGWLNRTQPAMPQFDLITAISTGALQAPFALIGTEAALDKGATLYRSTALEHAPTPDLWATLQAGNVKDGSRYRTLVEKVLDPSLQVELIHAFADKRSIAIATTDLDLGAQRIWELGHELDETERGLRRVRALLVASACVPGAFPPVMIDDHLHAAGAVSNNLLVPLQYEDYRVLASRLRALGITDSIEIRVWVIVNGFGQASEQLLPPEDDALLEERSRALAFRASQAEQLGHLADLARAVDGGVRGLHMQVRVTMIPAELAKEPGANDPYDEEWMMRLEQEGYERARGEAAWDQVVVPRGRDD